MPKVPSSYLDARRDEILDAAWTCFAHRGYHQTTMQDICREAEMSAGAVYRYFAKKEDILIAINKRSLEMGRRLVEDAISRGGGPLDALHLIGQTMIGALTNPAFEDMSRVNIEIWPEVLRNDRLREASAAELSFWQSAVAGILVAAKRTGQFPEYLDPESAAKLYICAYEGLRHFMLVSPESFQPNLLLELGRAFSTSEFTAEAIAPSDLPAISAGVPLGTRYPRIGRSKSPSADAPEDESGQRSSAKGLDPAPTAQTRAGA